MPLNNSSKKREILRRLELGDISIIKAFELLKEQEGSKEEQKVEGLGQDPIEEIVKELNTMIGLNNIKDLVKQLRAFVTIQKERKKQQLKVDSLVMHMIFKGNPGTGKTTVARILARLFKELGLLDKGHLKEVERADLVGEYIGHTAQKTRKMVESALGGILFIDEAYALARGGNRDFGKEAIDTLVKAMEDNRKNLIVILAGYPKEMDYFLQSNPGLNSRFPIQVDFEDYNLEELIEIGNLMVEEREYTFSKGAEAKLYSILSKTRQGAGVEEGNARTVRNLIEESIRNQAIRLVSKEKISKTDLMTITREDLPKIKVNN
ncbi:stage V sporulation protein K [Orenia metallireducens]|jgi:stage V sporulation protein K|uniref:Stage V sporulation protein K n=1 Tax=Orenia metallireducens TaxID=1413210 RepID=A0A285HT43_9FIRM|nr:AAA family ATPase [Orenia metallireducens]PRX24076.1 stage V sporulation protein K [Orenia metallireducens]SNY38908.1 stage V sporulation protein K [Orenia metallireducens]